MLTKEKLAEFGANVDEGLERCMNNEQFYFMLIQKSLMGDSFEKLKQTVESGDLKQGFELAHSLKGVFGNLAITPIFDTVSELTELLRAETQMDYTPYLDKLISLENELKAICAA